jgi:chromosome segregation ATPase
LSRDWRDLSAHADAVIGHYLHALSVHDADEVTEPAAARAAVAELTRAAAALREVLAQVLRFRDQYGEVLSAASRARAAAARAVPGARDAVAAARAALAEAAAAGLRDPALDAVLAEAAAAVAAAESELAQRRADAAATDAERARRAAGSVAERARALPGRAADVRRGAASVHTRREALGTRHERLAPVMSELRRRYPLSAWADVERAPQRAAAALAEVDEALAGLDGVLATPVLDVPAAAALLARVRTAAGRVDDEVRAATGRLEQLDAVAADPGALLTEVQHALVDARRFLAGLPEDRARRFRRTFEDLARRLPPLQEAARAERPDVGAVLREATAIEAGLAGLVRTARAD